MPKKTSSPCAEPATRLQSTVIIGGNRYDVCPCCGLPKRPAEGKGVLRRLDKLTVRLLRQAGYRVVGWRRAWLFLDQKQVEELTGQSVLLDGGKSGRKKGRISFFRRIQMAKGGVAAAWEDCFFAVMDEGRGGERE